MFFSSLQRLFKRKAPQYPGTYLNLQHMFRDCVERYLATPGEIDNKHRDKNLTSGVVNPVFVRAVLDTWTVLAGDIRPIEGQKLSITEYIIGNKVVQVTTVKTMAPFFVRLVDGTWSQMAVNRFGELIKY